MSAPWTVFPAALTITNTDVLACVQGGINKQYFRPLLLTAVPGEPIALASGTGTIGYDGSGNANVCVSPGKAIHLCDGTTNFVDVDTVGNVTIEPTPTKQLALQGNGASITLANDGSIAIASAPTKPVTISYTPTVPSDYVTPPTTVSKAIELLARVASNFGTTPIPDDSGTACSLALPLAFNTLKAATIPPGGFLWYVINVASALPYTIQVFAQGFSDAVTTYQGSCSALVIQAQQIGGPGSASAVAVPPTVIVRLSGTPGDAITFQISQP